MPTLLHAQLPIYLSLSNSSHLLRWKNNTLMESIMGELFEGGVGPVHLCDACNPPPAVTAPLSVSPPPIFDSLSAAVALFLRLMPFNKNLGEY